MMDRQRQEHADLTYAQATSRDCLDDIKFDLTADLGRASLLRRLKDLDDRLGRVYDMGRALTDPPGDDQFTRDEEPVARSVVGELHTVMDSISLKTQAIVGQLVVLTNRL